MARALLLAVWMLALAGAPGCADPVHEDAVEKLGGEAAGVPVGPLHRPGQPCVTCHGDLGPAESRFSLAGTVYMLRDDPLQPAPSAVVEIEDITGRVVLAGTNAAGNFYIPSDYWEPDFPIVAKVTLGNVKQQMQTHASRSGSCADCHVYPAGLTSPGHVFIAASRSSLPGAMP